MVQSPWTQMFHLSFFFRGSSRKSSQATVHCGPGSERTRHHLLGGLWVCTGDPGPTGRGLWWLGCKGEHEGEILEVTRGSLVPSGGKVWLPAPVFPFPAPLFSHFPGTFSYVLCLTYLSSQRAVGRGRLPYWKRGALIPDRATLLAGDGSAAAGMSFAPNPGPSHCYSTNSVVSWPPD